MSFSGLSVIVLSRGYFRCILSAFQSLLTPLISTGNLSAALNLRRREKLAVWRRTPLATRQLTLMRRKCNRDVLIQQRDRRTDGTNADNVSRGNKTRTKLAWLDLISPSGFLRDAASGNLQGRGVLGAPSLRRRCDYYAAPESSSRYTNIVRS